MPNVHSGNKLPIRIQHKMDSMMKEEGIFQFILRICYCGQYMVHMYCKLNVCSENNTAWIELDKTYMTNERPLDV